MTQDCEKTRYLAIGVVIGALCSLLLFTFAYFTVAQCKPDKDDDKKGKSKNGNKGEGPPVPHGSNDRALQGSIAIHLLVYQTLD